jgi:hypothetical protein
MIKNRDVDQAWRVYHKSIGFTKRLVLSETGAESASAVGLNGSPSSSLIYLDTSTDCTNASGQDYICYAFAEKKGFKVWKLTQVMEMLMEHLFIQGFVQLLLCSNLHLQQVVGKYMIIKEILLIHLAKDYFHI